MSSTAQCWKLPTDTTLMKPEDTTPTNLLPEPVRPEDWECCGSECGDACIYQIYYREKAAYDAQQQALKAQTETQK